MNKIHTDGILLDIDGTLWDSRALVAEGWNRALKSFGITDRTITAERLKSLFGKTMDVIAKELFSDIPSEKLKSLDKECSRQEAIVLKESTKDITYAGITETIEKLSQSFKIFIVSNCQDGYIEILLEKTGLSPYITDFESYGHTRKGKADNIKLLSDRNKLNAPVYVGDTQGDYESAREAGIPFIWASYGFGTPEQYTRKIQKFSELENMFE
jgi:phosphoglycolate phosphatase